MRTLICSIGFIMPLMFPFEFDSQDVNRALRESIFALIMISAFGVVSVKLDSNEVRRIILSMYALIVFYFVLSLVQTFLLSRQIYFGIPREFFVANEATIPGELDLLYSKLRATGTFGEPSYLGFILTSISFALMPLARKWMLPRLAILTVVLIALICQSLSFFIAMALLVAYERPGFREFKITVFLPAILIVGILGLSFSEIIEHFIGRVTSLADQTAEPSGFVRIFGPISILPEYLSEFPTGVPFYRLYPILEAYVPIGLRPLTFHDNGLVNFLLDFGFYGGLLLYFYFASVRDVTGKLYLFACGIFNGALLSIDKMGVMILIFSLYNSFSIYISSQDNLEESFRSLSKVRTKSNRRNDTIIHDIDA